MKLTLICAFVVLGALAVPGFASADVATDWNRTMVGALEVDHTPAPPAMRDAAIVQSAVFDALNGIERRYTPIHVQPAAPYDASKRAAVVGAAYESLVALFPAQRSTFDAQLQASLAEIAGKPDGYSIDHGLAWGKAVADEILAWRAGDGIAAVLPPYVPGGAPGDWAPTPPTFGPPLFRQFATMTPFALKSPSQFLPAPPPSLTSGIYTQDFNETKAMGGTTSAQRTPFEAQTAAFWGSDTPAAIWNRVADDLADANYATLMENARLLARMNVAMADAVIAIWNAKNTYDTWRPITAIQRADQDGNPDTAPDPAWAPLLPTPQFQEYPAGHPGVSNAGASVLASFYGDATPFTVTSAGLPGVVRSFTSFSEATAQVEDARVFGGMHFRFSCDTGHMMGAEVADYVLRNVARLQLGRDF
ncbi:MAG TPA: vanadium-dependent haloperoxidase [Gaiellaceae bacterium]|nr:vanadium-dependent haloperoxidase [Gaiellaceae bacterium]